MTKEWEVFCDSVFYDMWAVRPKGDKNFNSPLLFHVASKGEAERLKESLEDYENSIRSQIEGKVMKEFDKEIDTILGKHKLPTTGDIIVSDVLKISKTIVLKAIKEI
jgi:hypothetical protein